MKYSLNTSILIAKSGPPALGKNYMAHTSQDVLSAMQTYLHHKGAGQVHDAGYVSNPTVQQTVLHCMQPAQLFPIFLIFL